MKKSQFLNALFFKNRVPTYHIYQCLGKSPFLYTFVLKGRLFTKNFLRDINIKKASLAQLVERLTCNQ